NFKQRHRRGGSAGARLRNVESSPRSRILVGHDLFGEPACSRFRVVLQRRQMTITPTVCEIIWFAGLVAWYIIRYPFGRRAKRGGVTNVLLGWRKPGLLFLVFLGLGSPPGIYVLPSFPAALDHPLIPAIAILGVVTLCGALLLFYRSHADLGRNWSISL